MTEPVIELVARGTPNVVAYACGKCRRVAHDEQSAKRCCEPCICECGAVCPRPYTSCEKCRTKKWLAKQKAAFDKARKVSWRDYAGPVCIDGDNYSANVEEFIDRCVCDGIPLPEYVWGCEVSRLTLFANDILANELEYGEHHEDAYDSLVDVDELQAFLTAWCDKQTMESWFESHDIAVLLDGVEQERDEP